jgi:hypothetical protein
MRSLRIYMGRLMKTAPHKWTPTLSSRCWPSSAPTSTSNATTIYKRKSLSTSSKTIVRNLPRRRMTSKLKGSTPNFRILSATTTLIETPPKILLHS